MQFGDANNCNNLVFVQLMMKIAKNDVMKYIYCKVTCYRYC